MQNTERPDSPRLACQFEASGCKKYVSDCLEAFRKLTGSIPKAYTAFGSNRVRHVLYFPGLWNRGSAVQLATLCYVSCGISPPLQAHQIWAPRFVLVGLGKDVPKEVEVTTHPVHKRSVSGGRK